MLLKLINKFVSNVLLLLLIFSESTFSQPTLFIKEDKENYSLGKYLSLLEDKDGKLSIKEASSDSLSGKFVHYDKDFLNLRFTSSVYWFRLIVLDTLINKASGILNSNDERNWLIIKNDPLVEDIRFYSKNRSNVGDQFVETKAGSIINPAEKTIKANDFVAVFPVYKDVIDTVYIRMQTASQFIISFNMLTEGEYIIHSSEKNMFHGVFFGIFILLIAYNTLLYFSIKEKVYFYYVLYIASFALFVFIYQGYYFEVIGRSFFQDYFTLPLVTVTITAVFWLFLTREFLSTKIYFPLAYKILTYLTPAAPLLCLFIIVFKVTIKIAWLGGILALIFWLYYIIGVIIAFLALRKKIYISRYYLLAISGLTVAVVVYTSARNSFLPVSWNFFTQNILSIGVLWEALILAATVGYRFSLLKAEKEKEKAVMRNQIAADLHDEVGSNLSAIAMQSKMMMKDEIIDNKLKEKLQDISNLAWNTTDTIRDIVWFINPYHDNSQQLFIRMKELASKMLINLNYEFLTNENNEHIFESLPNLNARRHIYLIFKETLNNIVKHSNADDVTISFEIQEKVFVMEIRDDGKGFIEEEISYGEGLKNIRNRASYIGAELSISSKKEKGTVIILKVPLDM